MEITDKDVELIDNYLEGNLTEEEQALFRIRMQDEAFAGFVRFQNELQEELQAHNKPAEQPQSPLGYNVDLNKKASIARELGSKLWFTLIATMIVAALLSALLLR